MTYNEAEHTSTRFSERDTAGRQQSYRYATYKTKRMRQVNPRKDKASFYLNENSRNLLEIAILS